ncbi:MAG: hypothetical protein HN909_05585 [Phycisphaerales bacterium]|jgi:hypothetical protein|nr:hypothetical protein [Phycisphaerales bacterium]MBT7171225.1 hypothetical protein [Phycisphaerales bacterium]
MGIFSKLFGSPEEKKAKRIIQKAKRGAREKRTPLDDLGLAIIKASQDCTDQMKPVLDMMKNELADVIVFHEFLYFFMHLANRSAFTQLTERQHRELQKFLSSLISPVAINIFIDCPDEVKDKMRNEFYENLNNAEVEYSASKELFSKANPLTGDSLFSKLARNVTEVSGNDNNPAVLMQVLSSSVKAYTSLQLELLVKNAGAVLQ